MIIYLKVSFYIAESDELGIILNKLCNYEEKQEANVNELF